MQLDVLCDMPISKTPMTRLFVSNDERLCILFEHFYSWGTVSLPIKSSEDAHQSHESNMGSSQLRTRDWQCTLARLITKAAYGSTSVGFLPTGQYVRTESFHASRTLPSACNLKLPCTIAVGIPGICCLAIARVRYITDKSSHLVVYTSFLELQRSSSKHQSITTEGEVNGRSCASHES